MSNLNQISLDIIDRFENETGILHSSQNKAKLQLAIRAGLEKELSELQDKIKEIEAIPRDRSTTCGKGLCESNAFKLIIRNLEKKRTKGEINEAYGKTIERQAETIRKQSMTINKLRQAND